MNQGFEQIRVTNGHKAKFVGSVPAGFTMHLTIDDVVVCREINQQGQWRKKFAVRLRKGKPVIEFGPRFKGATYYAIPQKEIIDPLADIVRL